MTEKNNITTENETGSEESVSETVTKFEEFGLNEKVLRGVFGYGFEFPSEIQRKAIPLILKGGDVIAQSQSGTGKTGAFTISVLNTIDVSKKGCQAIIVVPTRELASQIVGVCKNLGTYTGIVPVLCVGGANIYQCREQIKSAPSIAIGTPGRLIDMLQRRFISNRLLKMLVLDEADELLSISFIDQMRTIVNTLPKSAQICLFSATMPDPALEITRDFMNDPEIILVEPEQLTLEGISQFYIDVGQPKWKFETFCDIYDMISVSQSIVYVNTKNAAEELKHNLEKNHFTVSVIHSKLPPTERESIMKQFRNGSTRILISTDLLSRGIDIQQVSIVINYELPHSNNKECYIHRIGRSGRFGRKGVAINFVTKRDNYKLEELEHYYKIRMQQMPMDISALL